MDAVCREPALRGAWSLPGGAGSSSAFSAGARGVGVSGPSLEIASHFAEWRKEKTPTLNLRAAKQSRSDAPALPACAAAGAAPWARVPALPRPLSPIPERNVPMSGLPVGLSITALNPHPVRTHALALGCVRRLILPRAFLRANWEMPLGSRSRGCFRSWFLSHQSEMLLQPCVRPTSMLNSLLRSASVPSRNRRTGHGLPPLV